MKFNPWFAAAALLAIAAALWQLHAAQDGVVVRPVVVDGTPATIFRPAVAPAAPRPVVVIAHGFAGSQQLMQSFALTFARNGYVALTFDARGHGRNPRPLTGDIARLDGATQTLLGELRQVAGYARGLGDGRLVVLGHSMASDIVVRFAQGTPGVAATIAVSMFSPAVTATSPPDLLVIVGEWEQMLVREALRAVGLAIAPAEAVAGVTYGDIALGSARRVAVSAHVEHASVLFSADSMREALDWLDQVSGTQRPVPPVFDGRGPWILLLVGGIVLLARPLAALLPRVSEPATGAGLGWRRFVLPLLVPMVATPLLLRVLPTDFLPVLVADYLAAHFAMYGLVTALCLAWLRRGDGARPLRPTPRPIRALVVATLAVVAYGFTGLAVAIDSYVTSFCPGPERATLIVVMFAGTLSYFAGDEWATHGAGTARGAHVASRVAFLVSLAIAVALDFERLFFLAIIVPVIVLFFVVYGLFSHWTYRQTGHPFVGAIASAVAFAWAIGVTFPLLAG